MRRLALALAFLLAMALLAGCSGPDTESASDGGADSAQEETHSFETMPMYANEKTALEHMPAAVEGYLRSAQNQGGVEGEDYLDISGVAPKFVGYEVIVWEPIAGSEDVEYVELPYVNGHLALSLGQPEAPLGDDQPRVLQFNKLNTRPIPDLPSEGEEAALAAAKEAMSSLFPDTSAMQYGVKRYLFLYEKDGRGVVVGTTLDGELGVNGEPVKLAK